MAYKVVEQRGRVDLEIARFSWPFAKRTDRSMASLRIYRWPWIVLFLPFALVRIARDYSI